MIQPDDLKTIETISASIGILSYRFPDEAKLFSFKLCGLLPILIQERGGSNKYLRAHYALNDLATQVRNQRFAMQRPLCNT